MGFWTQLAGTALLFAAVEAVEGGLRRFAPGYPHAVYWAVKVAVGLPLVALVAYAMRYGGYRIDAAAVTAGIAGAATVALWFYGDGDEEGEDDPR